MSWWCCCRCSKQTRLLFMIFFTFAFFFAEIFVGEYAHSNALKADAFHMLSDVLSLIIAYVSVYISPHKWKKNTYGFARAEVMGALVNSVFLISLSFTIFSDSLRRFIEPEGVEDPEMVIVIGSVGLGINLVGLVLFQDMPHGHSHGGSHAGHSHCRSEWPARKSDEEAGHARCRSERGHKELEHCKNAFDANRGDPNTIDHPPNMQMNIKGVFLHLLADALGSVIVIISACAIQYGPPSFEPYKLYVDPTLSILLVLLILCSAWPLTKEAAFVLLQTVPGHLEVNELQKELQDAVPDIVDVHEFHVWQLVASRVVASLHVQLRPNANTDDYMKYAGKIKAFFHKHGIHATTVQVEYHRNSAKASKDGCNLPCPDLGLSSECSEGQCCRVDESLASHDIFESEDNDHQGGVPRMNITFKNTDKRKAGEKH